MVPDRHHVPINAPTASRMKMAPLIDPMARVLAAWMDSHGCPFFRMISAAIMSQMTSAAGTAPLSAWRPNRRIAPPIRTTSATSGMTASASEGSRTFGLGTSSVVTAISRA